MTPWRPSRRMPSARRVAEYWANLADSPFVVDLAHPACFCCGGSQWEWGDLERAHLIDRCRDGLDHEANLAMLCWVCHKLQPSFGNDEWEKAVSWVANFEVWPEVREAITA